MPGPVRASKRVLTERQSTENLPTPKRHTAPWTTPTKTKENRRPSTHKSSASPLVGRRPSNQTVNSSPFTQFRTPTRPPRSLETAAGTPECFNRVELGTPSAARRASGSTSSKSDDSDNSSASEDGFSVTVGVRVRPFNNREKADKDVKCVIGMDGNEVTMSSRYGQPSFFCYDHCFWSVDKTSSSYSGQEAVYRAVGQPLLHSAFEGYNTCLFAYGQTGSGKSYTIMGSIEERGVIPRFCKDLFRRVEDPQETKVTYKVEVSFFEIYNEKIHDLLSTSVEKTEKWDRSTPKKITLKVREHPTQGPYVEGLSTFQARSYADINSWIEIGNKQRATAATGMNDKSSRSHSVFVIMMTKTKKETFDGEEHVHSVTSKINIIDLAGSERCAATNTTGDRLKEGANINRSLMTLGKVISGLSDKSLNPKKKVFIPYRDSVLTWLLRESLGGNSKTAMIATVSPASTQSEETLSTLRYAKQARSIINVAKVNEDPNARLIRELRTEIEKLKSMGLSVRGRRQSDEERKKKNEEVDGLKERLADSQKRMMEMEEAWKERMREEETKRRDLETKQVNAGPAYKVDNTLPNLVNLNEDPQLSEVLLYILQEGETHIGRCSGDSTPNGIHLNSALVKEDHCLIVNNGSYITVRPMAEAETFVNGDRMYRARRLHHGDRVVIGNYYFRYNDPKEVRQTGQRNKGKTKVDFEFARNELANAQGTRLEAQKEETRLQTQQEMLKGIEEAKKAAQREIDTQRRNFERKIKELESELRNLSMMGHKKEESFRQRSDSRVEELQQENKLLKQELESNRRRLEGEAREARRAMEQGATQQTRILAELEKEKQRIMKSVENLQEAQRERKGKKGRGVGQLRHRRDLLQLSMWLQEANNISNKLNRNLMFSRHDEQTSGVKGSEVKVRVNETRKGLMTFWSLDVFEEKLLQMREAFQGNCTSHEINEIFSGREGNWEADFKLDSPIAHRYTSSSSSSRDQSTASTTTPAARPRSSTTSSSSSHGNHGNTLDSITSACLHHLENVVMSGDGRGSRDAEEEEQTLADRTIGCMHRLTVAMETTREWSERRDEAFARPGASANVESAILQATMSVNLLTCLSSLWSTLTHRQDEERHKQRPHQTNPCQGLVRQMEECSQKVSRQVHETIQNMTRCSNQEAQMNAAELGKNLNFTARLLGELCFITDTPCWSIGHGENEEVIKIDFKLKQGFQDGADVFVDKTIQECLTAIGQFEIQLRSALQDRNLKGEVKKPLDLILSICTSAKILLNKTQDAQLELTSTLEDSDRARPGEWYSKNYARSLGLSGEIQDLRSHITGLFECIVAGWKGSEFDPLGLRMPTDALLTVTNLLPQAASTLDLLSNHHGNSSALSDASTTSSTADGPCRPSDLVRLASRQLVTHLRALQDYIRATVRKSRMPTDTEPGQRRNKHVRFAEHLNKKAFVHKYSWSDTDTS